MLNTDLRQKISDCVKEIRLLWIIYMVVIVLLVLNLNGCALIQVLFKNPHHIYENGAVLVGGDDRPIELINAPNADEVSYSQLLAFIKNDSTDLLPYIDRAQSELVPFVCSDFAETLHNNAEAAGIRAGYVGIDWQDGGIGHAINVFETTDRGIIYIDCTGQSIYSQLDTWDDSISSLSWDKVAYIEIGQIYGVLSLEKAESPDYAFYQEFQQKWEDYKSKLAAYNTAVKQYNQYIQGKTFRPGSEELREVKIQDSQLREEQQTLNALAAEIGTLNFKPLGVVKSISIHW
jgi:hypothetical protein